MFAWATMERHILIFYDGWVSTKKKRFFVQYLPLVFVTLFCLIFFIVVYFFPPCNNLFNNLNMLCASACFIQIYVLRMCNLIVFEFLPNLLIVFFSVGLFIRVLIQKYRLRRSIQWRKYRKMIIQLLSISLLYILISFPLMLMDLISASGLYIISSAVERYAAYLSYYQMFLLPFFLALSLPELRVKIKNIFKFGRRRRVSCTDVRNT